MFERISLNRRILGSIFDQANNSLIRPTPRAEEMREGMETCIASFLHKIICYHEMRKTSGSYVEVSPQIFLGSMFDAEVIYAQIPSNIEPIYH
jgi:hypothetical protein